MVPIGSNLPLRTGTDIDVIQDFEIGIDQIALAGLVGIGHEDMEITSQRDRYLVEAGSIALEVKLAPGQDGAALSEDDFQFI